MQGKSNINKGEWRRAQGTGRMAIRGETFFKPLIGDRSYGKPFDFIGNFL